MKDLLDFSLHNIPIHWETRQAKPGLSEHRDEVKGPCADITVWTGCH